MIGGPLRDATLLPSSVNLQTIQSGFNGLANHGVAHPALTHTRTVLALTARPCPSNRGSFPPGRSRPRSR